MEKNKHFRFIKDFGGAIKDSIIASENDNVMKLSAALAYYTIFSIAPMMIVIMGLCSIFYGKDAIQGEVYLQLAQWVGSETASQVQEIIKNTTLKHDTFIATIVGAITLFLGATGIFSEIQDSINTIWGLKAIPKKGFLKFLLNRLMSFSMVLALGFILLVSLVLNALLSTFLTRLEAKLSSDIVNYVLIVDHIAMAAVISLLFACIFKVLPDAKVKWVDVWMGALVTTILFFIGKFLIGYYLEYNSSITAFGATSSLIVLLLWVYYTSIILYFGAEFTHTYLKRRGRRIEPTKYATLIQISTVSKEYNTKINKEKTGKSLNLDPHHSRHIKS